MMNSMQRIDIAMQHREPDRVPWLLFTTMHGARELGLSIRDYFSRADYVIEGQLRLLAKFRGDCLIPAGNAAFEAEAFGSETVYMENGPPNVGTMVIRRNEDIDRLSPPRLAESPSLMRDLETIRGLKRRVGDSVPVLGGVVSPFSLPVMQMGFDRYLDLIYEDRARFNRLMAVNEVFCVEWANAQLAAGATAIGYADPVSSTTIIPRKLFLETGFPVAQRTLAKIRGPTAFHLASGRGLAIAGEIAATNASAVGISTLEDISQWKQTVGDRLTLIGNLNGLEMPRWTAEQAELEVKRAIQGAARGGGFMLADNHGEIPWQVPDEVLFSIRHAIERWGRYPLDWLGPA